MNETLNDKLRVLAEDKITLEAIKAVFDNVIEKFKPDVEKMEDDNIVGQKYRAYIQAKNLVKYAFQDIEARKVSNVKTDKENRGK